MGFVLVGTWFPSAYRLVMHDYWSAGLSTMHSMSTRRLESWVESTSTARPGRGRPRSPGRPDCGRRRSCVMTIGTAILCVGPARPVAARPGRSCSCTVGAVLGFVVSLTSSQTAASRPSRCAGSSRPARLPVSMSVTDLPSSSDSVTAWYSQVSRRPSMRCRRSSVASDAAIGRHLRRERQRGASGGDRVEQLLRGEVEAGELLRGEHADGEPRRRDGALHEHAVELELHHRVGTCATM